MLTALLLSLSLSAPGVEAILVTPAAQLDGPAKTKLGAAVIGVFAGADLTEVKNYNCTQDMETNILSCDGMYDDRQAESVFIDLSIAGKVSETYDTAPEGFVDFKRHAPKKDADAAAKTKIQTFVEAVFAGVTIDIFHSFRCERNPKDETQIACRCWYYDIVSDPTYVTLVQLKSVLRPIRKVEIP